MYSINQSEIVGYSNKGEFVTIPVGCMVRNVINWETKSLFDYSLDGGMTWVTVKTLNAPTVSKLQSPKIKQSNVFRTLF